MYVVTTHVRTYLGWNETPRRYQRMYRWGSIHSEVPILKVCLFLSPKGRVHDRKGMCCTHLLGSTTYVRTVVGKYVLPLTYIYYNV